MRSRWLALPVAMWLVFVLTGASHVAEPGIETSAAIEQEIRRLDGRT